MFKWFKYTSKESASKALDDYGNEQLESEDVEYIAIIKRFPKFMGYKLELGIIKDRFWVRRVLPSFTKKESKIPKYFIVQMPSDSANFSKKIDDKTVWTKKNYSREHKLKRIEVPKNELLSISTPGIKRGGTFGSIFQLETFEGFYGLTNSHVLFDAIAAPIGSPVYYPRESNLNSRIIGETVWKSDENLDACIFKIYHDETAKKILKDVPRINMIRKPKIGQRVSKFGLSYFSTGKVRSDNVILRFDKSSEDRILRNQVQFKKFTSPGDSGTVVFTLEKYSIGLIHSIDERKANTYSYANNIKRLFNRPLLGKEKYFRLNGKEIEINQLTLK